MSANESNVIVLPDQKEIMRRLLTVCNDGYLVELYMSIAREAGKEFLAWKLVDMLIRKLYYFTEHHPLSIQVVLMLPQYIDALVNDEDEAKAAKTFLLDTIVGAKELGKRQASRNQDESPWNKIKKALGH